MKLEFGAIINKHKNRPALVISHGPSLNAYLTKLQTLKEKEFILIDCNEWMDFSNTIPHYWVIANSSLTVCSWKEKINNYKNNTILVYADSIDTTNKQWVAQNIEVDYLSYDQRHFNETPCSIRSSCCANIEKSRKTIQEELRDYCKVDFKYGTGDSVSIHQIALAVLLGCNPVYFVGIDLNYSLGYANNLPSSPHNELLICKPRIINDIKIIENSAKNINIEIINLNKNSDFPFKTGEI